MEDTPESWSLRGADDAVGLRHSGSSYHIDLRTTWMNRSWRGRRRTITDEE
jgi:hypothetical protein